VSDLTNLFDKEIKAPAALADGFPNTHAHCGAWTASGPDALATATGSATGLIFELRPI
jgi:hypothetical protein